MQFGETLASLTAEKGGFSAEVSDDWSQGRAVFGGMVAALGNEAMRRSVAAVRPLRGLEVTFVGPLLPGTVRIETEVLRVGKAVTIVQARMFSGDHISSTLVGVYGSARTVAVSIDPTPAPGVAGVASLPDSTLPPQSGGPKFLQHFDIRWAEGARPFTGTPLNRSKAYLRHRNPDAATESHIIALIDCIPSPVLQMMTSFAPASSLVWSLEFFRHDFNFAPDGWWRIDTEVGSSADGYASQSSVVLDPRGTPVAFSRQLVAVFG